MYNRGGYQQYPAPSGGFYQNYNSGMPSMSAPVNSFPANQSHAPPVSSYSSFNTASNYYNQYGSFQGQGQGHPGQGQGPLSSPFQNQPQQYYSSQNQLPSAVQSSFTHGQVAVRNDPRRPPMDREKKDRPPLQDRRSRSPHKSSDKNKKPKDELFMESYLTPGLNIEILPNSKLMCKVCKVSCGTGLKEYFIHMNDSAHGQAVFSHLVPYHSEYNRNPKQFLYCEICDAKLKLPKAYVSHVFGKAHIKRARQLMQLDAPLNDDSSSSSSSSDVEIVRAEESRMFTAAVNKSSGHQKAGSMKEHSKDQRKKQEKEKPGNNNTERIGQRIERARNPMENRMLPKETPKRMYSAQEASREEYEQKDGSAKRLPGSHRQSDKRPRRDYPVAHEDVATSRTEHELVDEEWSLRARQLQRQVGKMSEMMDKGSLHQLGNQDWHRSNDRPSNKSRGEEPMRKGRDSTIRQDEHRSRKSSFDGSPPHFEERGNTGTYRDEDRQDARRQLSQGRQDLAQQRKEAYLSQERMSNREKDFEGRRSPENRSGYAVYVKEKYKHDDHSASRNRNVDGLPDRKTASKEESYSRELVKDEWGEPRNFESSSHSLKDAQSPRGGRRQSLPKSDWERSNRPPKRPEMRGHANIAVNYEHERNVPSPRELSSGNLERSLRGKEGYSRDAQYQPIDPDHPRALALNPSRNQAEYFRGSEHPRGRDIPPGNSNNPFTRSHDSSRERAGHLSDDRHRPPYNEYEQSSRGQEPYPGHPQNQEPQLRNFVPGTQDPFLRGSEISQGVDIPPKRREHLTRGHEPPHVEYDHPSRGRIALPKGYEHSPRRHGPSSPDYKSPRGNEILMGYEHLPRDQRPPSRSYERSPVQEPTPIGYDPNQRWEQHRRGYGQSQRGYEALPRDYEHPSENREHPSENREPPLRGFDHPPESHELPSRVYDDSRRGSKQFYSKEELQADRPPRQISRQPSPSRHQIPPRDQHPLGHDVAPQRHEVSPRRHEAPPRGPRSPPKGPRTPPGEPPKNYPRELRGHTFVGRHSTGKEAPPQFARSRSPRPRHSQPEAISERRGPGSRNQTSDDGFGQAEAVSKERSRKELTTNDPGKGLPLSKRSSCPEGRNSHQKESTFGPRSQEGRNSSQKESKFGPRRNPYVEAKGGPKQHKERSPVPNTLQQQGALSAEAQGSSLLAPEAIENLRRMGYEGDPEDFVRLVASIGSMGAAPAVVNPLLSSTSIGVMPQAIPPLFDQSITLVDNVALPRAIQIMSTLDPAVLQSLNTGDPRALEMLQRSLSPEMLQSLAALSPQIIQAVGGNVPPQADGGKREGHRKQRGGRRHIPKKSPPPRFRDRW